MKNFYVLDTDSASSYGNQKHNEYGVECATLHLRMCIS